MERYHHHPHHLHHYQHHHQDHNRQYFEWWQQVSLQWYIQLLLRHQLLPVLTRNIFWIIFFWESSLLVEIFQYKRTMRTRQLAMIYPTFTPASTSSVVSSAFDTSHAPQLPTGQTACWRLIFTRPTIYLFSLSLQSCPIFTRLTCLIFTWPTKLFYFHSAHIVVLFSLGSQSCLIYTRPTKLSYFHSPHNSIISWFSVGLQLPYFHSVHSLLAQVCHRNGCF